jgi:predicted TIM-barrel fold metal-dependent hydrolase
MIIDAHRHVGWAGRRGHVAAAQVLESMDRNGVDRTIIVPINIMPETVEREDARQSMLERDNRGFVETGCVTDAMCRARQHVEDHAEVVAAVREAPDRFVGVWLINPWRGSAALQEAERAVDQHHFHGFKLHPMVCCFPADNPIVDPVFALADKLDVPVIYHSSYGAGTEPWRVAKAAGRHPNVQTVLYHAGVIGLDNKIQAQDAVEQACAHENIWIDLADAQLPALTVLIDHGPRDRLIFGSDDPFGNLEVQWRRVHEVLADRAALREKIIGINAARLWKLAPKPKSAAKGK